MATRGQRSSVALAALGACAVIALAAPVGSSAALVPGELVVADARALDGGALIAVDPSTGAESLISSNQMGVNADSQLFAWPFTLALDEQGNILVANTQNMGGSCTGGCGGVIEVNPTTGAESVLSSNAMPINADSQYFNQPVGITVDSQGDILVSDWGDCDGCGEVIDVNPTTGKETLIASNAMPINADSQYFGYVQGIAIDQAGDILIADPEAFGSGGGIIEVNPSTGKESELAANSMAINSGSQYFHSPSQLAVDAAGDILVADWCETDSCGGIVEVNPQTGKETQLSANSMAINSGSQLFYQPTAVALDATGRIIEVQEQGLGGSCSGGCGGLVYVDPTTGQETELSANSLAVNATNQLFVEPFDVAVVPASFPELGGSGPPAPDTGGPGGTTPEPTPAPTPLAIGALAQSRERWRPRAGGTVLSFTLNEAAQVTLQFARVRNGRALAGECAAASRRNRHHPRCSYTTPAGTLAVSGHIGTNTVDFAGRLSPTVALRAGRYELSASATAGGSQVAATGPSTLSFTIVG